MARRVLYLVVVITLVSASRREASLCTARPANPPLLSGSCYAGDDLDPESEAAAAALSAADPGASGMPAAVGELLVMQW